MRGVRRRGVSEHTPRRLQRAAAAAVQPELKVVRRDFAADLLGACHGLFHGGWSCTGLPVSSLVSQKSSRSPATHRSADVQAAAAGDCEQPLNDARPEGGGARQEPLLHLDPEERVRHLLAGTAVDIRNGCMPATPSAWRSTSRSTRPRDDGRAVAYQGLDHRAAPAPQRPNRGTTSRHAAHRQCRTPTPRWSP